MAKDYEKEKEEIRARMKVPEDFEFEGMSKANGYLMEESGLSGIEWNRERFRRSGKVARAWQKDSGYLAAAREMGTLTRAKAWDERRRKNYERADAAEVMLLEKMDSQGEGVSTNEMVASCINLIAKELAKRGVAGVEELKTSELINISNHLLALTKAASNVRRSGVCDSKIIAQNVTINAGNSSKTGGVVGGIRDVIDLRGEGNGEA